MTVDGMVGVTFSQPRDSGDGRRCARTGAPWLCGGASTAPTRASPRTRSASSPSTAPRAVQTADDGDGGANNRPMLGLLLGYLVGLPADLLASTGGCSTPPGFEGGLRLVGRVAALATADPAFRDEFAGVGSLWGHDEDVTAVVADLLCKGPIDVAASKWTPPAQATAGTPFTVNITAMDAVENPVPCRPRAGELHAWAMDLSGTPQMDAACGGDAFQLTMPRLAGGSALTLTHLPTGASFPPAAVDVAPGPQPIAPRHATDLLAPTIASS
ncbi:hypothetical protein PAPYR_8024 [Paratrimastix pyriformis]|uniref:Uncharacterized protein n=1 Tax=Paratrimastix pyriformis TaxID=342808 RepID=A0ABQ8UBQ7_9EUKA|nr:hypothetical protein PAPYR_8024 [Paratrimastix pyriformis]